MKKVILLTGVIVMMYAASAFATTASTVVPTTISGFTKSKNVGAVYESGTTSSSGFAYYTIATKHSSGTKIYGAISTDAGMYSKDDATIGEIAVGEQPAVPTASTATVSGWTSM